MMCLTCTGTSTVPDICKKLCNIAHHRLVPRLRENAPMLSEISGENTVHRDVYTCVRAQCYHPELKINKWDHY